jgi:hypothetical protein
MLSTEPQQHTHTCTSNRYGLLLQLTVAGAVAGLGSAKLSNPHMQESQKLMCWSKVADG